MIPLLASIQMSKRLHCKLDFHMYILTIEYNHIYTVMAPLNIIYHYDSDCHQFGDFKT